MRLLDTSTYVITEFHPPNIPVYAILSHTWEEDEYIFADRNVPHRRNSAGFRKISACCTLAASEGWQYLWVDTCCIDKSSSAELTEAINSMYKWYEMSEVCYVYLADYSLESADERPAVAFGDCRWFTRGWTLQELLAPKSVVFYDREWVEIGSKSYLESCLIEICGIESHFFTYPRSASVAMKMSWVSRRQTSREEDMAYCLLGLFDINMSLIYGEGQNAFFRLQCEIIQRTSDESIFAWEDHEVKAGGLLARNPSAFAESNDIFPLRLKRPARPPWRMTNIGLELELDVEIHNSSGPTQTSPRRYTTFLACARRWYPNTPVVLRLRMEGEEFAVRENCNQLLFDTTGLMGRLASLERRTLYFQNRHTMIYTPPALSRSYVEFKVLLTQAARSYLRLNISSLKDHILTVVCTSRAIAAIYEDVLRRKVVFS